MLQLPHQRLHVVRARNFLCRERSSQSNPAAAGRFGPLDFGSVDTDLGKRRRIQIKTLAEMYEMHPSSSIPGTASQITRTINSLRPTSSLTLFVVVAIFTKKDNFET